MEHFIDKDGREIRLSNERKQHIEMEHPEMANQFDRVAETLRAPHRIVRSQTDQEVGLYYRFYETSPVTQKYMCIIVKSLAADPFIITAFYTDTIKKGDVLWETQ